MTEPLNKRVRLNTNVTPETHAAVKQLNEDGVARSDGAVIDLAVETLKEKVAIEGINPRGLGKKVSDAVVAVVAEAQKKGKA